MEEEYRRTKGRSLWLVLYTNDESSHLKTGNQSNSLILKNGSILNESGTSSKIEDRKELVLHVEYVKEEQVNTNESKDISTTVANSSNNDMSTSKNKGVKIIDGDIIAEQYLM